MAKKAAKKVPLKKASTEKKNPTKKASPKKQTKSVKPPVKKKVPTKTAAKKAVKKQGKTKQQEELMCFLTTACVQHYGLQDDCIQLSTLRWYRDSYLRSTEEGNTLVEEYYQVAPRIVKAIEEQEKQGVYYPYIFSEVEASCTAIAELQFPKARVIYQRMVERLKAEVL